MNRLAKIVRAAKPSDAVQFRDQAYGPKGLRDFLRDVIALANAAVEGPRYLVVGVEFDETGARRLCEIDGDDFSGNPAYESLVGEFIEPAIPIRYQPVSIDGKRFGVYEIGVCQDRPYMMRADLSETLRRGDAYARVSGAAVKLGRRQLQALFESRLEGSFATAEVEIGFPGEIIHKRIRVATTDLEQLPSTVAARKLEQMIDVRRDVAAPGSTTMVARLTHARLFGSDVPYEHHSTDTLSADMCRIANDYKDPDLFFLFEQQASRLQLVVYNQGDDALRDAALTLKIPRHRSIHVATALPKVPANGEFVDRSPIEQSSYPRVTVSDDAVRVSAMLGDIPGGRMVDAFESPARLCVDRALAGRKSTLRFSMSAQNLREPVTGKLGLTFVGDR